jgi:hypothetical protein
LASQDRRSIVRANLESAILALAVGSCLLQILWFWRFCHRNINFDAISYIGIARLIVEGKGAQSINGYWSPLTSWLLAFGALSSGNLLMVGRVVTILTFGLCLILLYILTKKLWHSGSAAALAVLLFSLARGVVYFSESFIGADCLLTACVLAYFITLLSCLRKNQSRDWVKLGGAHGLTYLAKAVALPWLSATTFLAVVLTSENKPGRAFRTLALALFLPVLIWGSWGTALRSKYGAFMSGYQFRKNLIEWGFNKTWTPQIEGLSSLRDTSLMYGAYMVNEPLAPHTPPWSYSLINGQVLWVVLRGETSNLPRALREFVILLTPGVLLAFVLALAKLSRPPHRISTEARFAWILSVSTAIIFLMYCMLAFDNRYVLPLVPVFIAFSIRFLLPGPSYAQLILSAALRRAAGALTLASVAFSLFYWASPFRVIRQDVQESCYQAAELLRQHPGEHTVSIGQGPYPVHGVGWEAGVYTAYFADRRVVADLTNLPADEPGRSQVIADIRKLKPDSVLVWGNPRDSAYTDLVDQLGESHVVTTGGKIRDPKAGEVGTVFFAN